MIAEGGLQPMVCNCLFARQHSLDTCHSAWKYLTRLDTMDTDRLLKHAFIADCRVKPGVSWCLHLEHQLQGHLIPSPTEEQPHHRQFSLVSAQSQHAQQLRLEPSSKGMSYRQIKMGYACEPYIQQANSQLRRRLLRLCICQRAFSRSFLEL